MPVLQRRARVGELAVDNVRRRQDFLDRGGLVRHRLDGTAAPVIHPTEYRRQVVHGADGVFLVREQGIAGEAGLLAAVPVIDQLVAVLANVVKCPFIDTGDARADERIRYQVVVAPGRVVGPGLLEGAVPNPRVGARFRVIVTGDRDDAQLGQVGPGRDLVAELLGIHRDAHQRTAGVVVFGVHHFGEDVPGQRVFDVGLVAFLVAATNPDVVIGRPIQVDAVAALVGRRVLALNVVIDDRNPRPGALLDVDGHRQVVRVHVAGLGVGLDQGWNFDSDDGGVGLSVQHGTHDGRVERDLSVDLTRVRYVAEPFHGFLIGGAQRGGDHHAIEILGAVVVLDRGAVEIDTLVAVHQPANRPPGQQVQNAAHDVALKGVWRFNRWSRRLGFAASGPGEYRKCLVVLHKPGCVPLGGGVRRPLPRPQRTGQRTPRWSRSSFCHTPREWARPAWTCW